MAKKTPAIKYQGFHTHPSQDSTIKRLDDGTLLIGHRIDKRQGFIITQLVKMPQTTADLTETLNEVFPNGGYNQRHVKHACDRLREAGIVKLQGMTWVLVEGGREKFAKLSKVVTTYKGK